MTGSPTTTTTHKPGRRYSMSTTSSTTIGTTSEAAADHRVRWYVYAGGEQMPREDSMRGEWPYDAKCSCGWESRTGGATRSFVRGMVWAHRRDAKAGR